jgi:hypothetical protein
VKLLIFGAVALVTLAACGGDKPAPAATQPAAVVTQAPAPVASPTPSAQTADLARSFREFLPQVDVALQQREADFFRTRALARRVTCEPVDVQRRMAGGCLQAGQQFDGIDVAQWRSDQGGPVTIDAGVNLVARLWTEMQQGSDEFGSSAPRVYALAVTPNAPDGSPQAAAVLTAMIRPPANANPPTTAPRRAVLVTHWRRLQGQWRLMVILDATTALGEDFLRPTPEGRAYIGAWERYQP